MVHSINCPVSGRATKLFWEKAGASQATKLSFAYRRENQFGLELGRPSTGRKIDFRTPGVHINVDLQRS